MWIATFIIALPVTSLNNCNCSCEKYAWPTCLADTNYDISFCRSEIDSQEQTLIQERGCNNECCMQENCKTALLNCASYMGLETCEGLRNGNLYRGSQHNLYHICKYCS